MPRPFLVPVVPLSTTGLRWTAGAALASVDTAQWLQGQSKFLSEISQRKMSEMSLSTARREHKSSLMDVLTRNSQQLNRRSMAPTRAGDSLSTTSRRSAAQDDIAIPVPDAAILRLLTPKTGPRPDPSQQTPSILNACAQGDSLDPPPSISDLRPTAQLRSSALLSRMKKPLLPSGNRTLDPPCGSPGRGRAGAGAPAHAVTSAGEPAAGNSSPLGALWSTAHSSLSGRRKFTPHRGNEPAGGVVASDSEPAIADRSFAGDVTFPAASAGIVQSEDFVTPIHIRSKLYESPRNGPGGSSRTSADASQGASGGLAYGTAPARAPAAPRAGGIDPYTTPVKVEQGFQGPFHTLEELAMSRNLRHDLPKADSAPAVMWSDESAQGEQGGGSAGAMWLGSDMHSMGSGSGASDGSGGMGLDMGRAGAALVVPSYAVDFQTGTLRFAHNGREPVQSREGGGQVGRPAREERNGSALGEGLQRHSNSSSCMGEMHVDDWSSGAAGDGDGEKGRRGSLLQVPSGIDLGATTSASGSSGGKWWRLMRRAFRKQKGPQTGGCNRMHGF